MMELNAVDLRRHYASLSEQELLAIDRADLTTIAQGCYDDEVAQRQIAPPLENGTLDGESEPEWVKDAACACSFDASPRNNSAPDLEEARNILESAGIPCYVKVSQLDESGCGPQPRVVYELLVPGGVNLSAISILDKELFNSRLEAEWRIHLQELSDEDFDALNLEDLTAGLLDRVHRLEQAYTEEQTRRDLSSS
jgi:hypothetical protein